MNPTKARITRPPKPPVTPPITAPTGNDCEFGIELGLILFVCSDAGVRLTVGVGTVNPEFALGVSPKNLYHNNRHLFNLLESKNSLLTAPNDRVINIKRPTRVGDSIS